MAEVRETPISPAENVGKTSDGTKQLTEKSAGLPTKIFGKIANLANGQALKTMAMEAAAGIQEKALPAMEKLRDRYDVVQKRMDILNMSDADREALKEKAAEEQRVAELSKTPEGREQLEREAKQKEEAEKERVKKAEEFMDQTDKDIKKMKKEMDESLLPESVKSTRKTPEELAHEAKMRSLTDQGMERIAGDFANGDYKEEAKRELREEQNLAPTPKQEVKV